MSAPAVFAVVVTYNRLPLLKKCIAALQAQTLPPQQIVILDNASTDGTREWITSSLLTTSRSITYLRMDENLGGAGGFSRGLAAAVQSGADWAWMMDDDAEPEPDALEELMALAPAPDNIYGSIAASGRETSWLTTLLESGGQREASTVEEIPAQAEVVFLPFLGILVSRQMVQRIGLPDPGFFIAADDVEYCMRARQAGARVFVAGRSRIQHPKAQLYKFGPPGKQLGCLRLVPWKRYYDTRNRLLIARRYYGIRVVTQTIPGSFLRLYAALCREPDRRAQLWAFIAGFIDGLLGLKGRRHTFWKIKQ